MKKKQYSFLLMLVIVACCAKAQTAGYHYKAAINPVTESGLYNIVFTPAITAHIKTDYSDLRVVNNAGKWVPHLLRNGNERATETALCVLPVINKVSIANFTQLIIKSDSSYISNIVLKLKNTDAERFCAVTGSDDARNWFTIIDSVLIKPINTANENTAGFTIFFPRNNYRYYKLSISNKGKAPFNITGIYTAATLVPNSSSLQPSLENPAAAIFQQDSGRYSFVRVTQTAAYHVNEIQLKISGAKYFYRKVDFYIPSSSNHSFKNHGQLLQSFIISNNSTLQYKLPIINATVFYLIINNEDNLPLKIEAVKTLSSTHTAIAYLENENKYNLLLGNSSALAPLYDLQQLHIAADITIPPVSIGNIMPISQPLINVQKPTKKWMIWLAIATAGLALSYFTYKLVKDMNKEKK